MPRTDSAAFKWMNIGEFVYKRQEQVSVKLETPEEFGWVSNPRGEGMEHLSQVWILCSPSPQETLSPMHTGLSVPKLHHGAELE